MAEQQPSLSIDTDWKKQAQEEKRRLAEEQQKKAAAPPTTAPAPPSPRGGAGQRGRRDLPPVIFGTMVQSIMTQALYYLGDLSPQGGESMLNLDMAKHHVDMLTLLEAKTTGNLSSDEQQMLDAALYEVRMRYVNVATQYI